MFQVRLVLGVGSNYRPLHITLAGLNSLGVAACAKVVLIPVAWPHLDALNVPVLGTSSWPYGGDRRFAPLPTASGCTDCRVQEATTATGPRIRRKKPPTRVIRHEQTTEVIRAYVCGCATQSKAASSLVRWFEAAQREPAGRSSRRLSCRALRMSTIPLLRAPGRGAAHVSRMGRQEEPVHGTRLRRRRACADAEQPFLGIEIGPVNPQQVISGR